jgi:hypothetical protein
VSALHERLIAKMTTEADGLRNPFLIPHNYIKMVGGLRRNGSSDVINYFDRSTNYWYKFNGASYINTSTFGFVTKQETLAMNQIQDDSVSSVQIQTGFDEAIQNEFIGTKMDKIFTADLDLLTYDINNAYNVNVTNVIPPCSTR